MIALAELILFVVSVLPVFLIGMYIYKKDKRKESPKLLTKLFLGGMGSCFLVLIVSLILGLIFPIFSTNAKDLNLMELLILLLHLNHIFHMLQLHFLLVYYILILTIYR